MQLTSPVSLSTSIEPGVLKDIVFENPRSRIVNSIVGNQSDHAIELSRRASRDLEGSLPTGMTNLPKTPSESCSGGSPTSPPYRRRVFQIKPMDTAPQLRQTGVIDFWNMGFGEILDFDNESNPGHFPSRTFRHGMLSGNDAKATTVCVAEDSKQVSGSSRWSSFERRDGHLTRLNRSATVDAFSYQKVYPKRKMPQSARKLNFDRPNSSAPEGLDTEDSESEQESVHLAH